MFLVMVVRRHLPWALGSWSDADCERWGEAQLATRGWLGGEAGWQRHITTRDPELCHHSNLQRAMFDSNVHRNRPNLDLDMSDSADVINRLVEDDIYDYEVDCPELNDYFINQATDYEREAAEAITEACTNEGSFDDYKSPLTLELVRKINQRVNVQHVTTCAHSLTLQRSCPLLSGSTSSAKSRDSSSRHITRKCCTRRTRVMSTPRQMSSSWRARRQRCEMSTGDNSTSTPGTRPSGRQTTARFRRPTNSRSSSRRGAVDVVSATAPPSSS